MIDILCIGHGCRDIILPLREFPVENTKYVVPEFRESPGGPACNAASLLARWGASVAFMGLLGDDEEGKAVVRDLSDWGVDLSLTELRPRHPTPVSFIIANEANGSRTIFNRKRTGVFLKPAPDDFLREYGPAGPRVLLFDGHELEASLAAMAAWPKAVTILDAGSLRTGTETLSGRVDYCISSEKFAREIAGAAPGDALTAPKSLAALAEALHSRGAKHTAVTLGEKGCVYREGNRTLHLPAYPARAVDTTGAGDIFHGAFAFGILEGRDFPEALRLSAAAAGLSVQKPGGRDSIPFPEEALEALKHWKVQPGDPAY